MSTTTNSKANPMELVAPYFVSSVERTAELQKTYLDAAAGQFKELLALNKKIAGYSPIPLSYIFDAAERSFDKGVEIQKSLIGVAVEHTQTVVRISSEAQPDLSKVAEQVTSIVRKSVEQATAVQNDVTDFTVEEARKATDAATKQLDLAGTPAADAADTFKKNLGAIVDMQKTIVDAATKPLKASTAKAK